MSAAGQPGNAAAPVRRVAALEEALALAARKGAWIEHLAERAESGARHAVLQEATGAPQVLAHLAAAVFETLRQQGAVALDASGSRWRLNDKGRAALRRLRSRRGEPGTAARGQPPLPLPEGRERPEVNASESPIAWLRRRLDKSGRPMLSEAQFAAGERLRADIHFAQLGPRVTSSWSPAAVPGGGGRAPGTETLGDRALAARERVNRALAAVGPELCGILVDVCGHLKGLEDVEEARGWAKRSAKVVLDLALNALARHYGYIAEAAAASDAPPGRIRHWGGADYRPGIELADGETTLPTAGITPA